MVAALFAPLYRRIHVLRQTSLVMNAAYLMLSTFVVAISGFLFWTVVTRTYSAEAVGLATSVLSVSGLLALLGLAGFDSAMIRFLPALERKNEYINSGFIIVGGVTALIAAALAVGLPRLSPSLAMLSQPATSLAFIFFTVVTALNILSGAIFLAFKRARYTLIITVLFCLVKVALPLVIAGGSAMLIFMLAGMAQLTGLLLNLWVMRRRFNYRFGFAIDLGALRQARMFSFSMYTASILNLLPPTLLPLIILHMTEPQNAAYYYMAFTIAGVLYTIAYATMQSAFAEGSHNKVALKAHITKAAKMVVTLLVPAAIATYVLGDIALGIFGSDYAQHAAHLLQLYALSAIPVAFYSALGAIFKVTKNLRAAITMNLAYAATILGLSCWLVPQAGIAAIGWAWLIGNVTACVVGTFCIITVKNKGGTYAEATSAGR